MTKKLVVTLLAAVVLVVVILGVMTLTKDQNETAEESSEVISGTEILIVPSEMPERITMQVDPAFSETKSPNYEKYYICNDASVIVTGEELNAEERQNSFTQMMEIALDTAVAMAKLG